MVSFPNILSDSMAPADTKYYATRLPCTQCTAYHVDAWDYSHSVCIQGPQLLATPITYNQIVIRAIETERWACNTVPPW